MQACTAQAVNLIFNVKLCKGEIPIEKNVIVTDLNGKRIGATYPKRAKGLVKNGRAEYVSDCENGTDRTNDTNLTIRILDTHKPTVDITEVNNMSKVINFDPRDFKADKSCESNVIAKYFVTDKDGKNAIVYSIGNWDWDWTQICCDKKLEKNTDYVFRFVIVGGYCDTGDETSRFEIVPMPDGSLTDEAYENRYTYDLAQNRYKPVLCKKTDEGMLRLFEIPFSTFDCEDFRFVFVAMHAVATLCAPKELSAYADLEDMTFDEVKAEINSKDDDTANVAIDLSGAFITRSALNDILIRFGDNGNFAVDLSGACIAEDVKNKEQPDSEYADPSGSTNCNAEDIFTEQ